jgi:hypothetical protein
MHLFDLYEDNFPFRDSEPLTISIRVFGSIVSKSTWFMQEIFHIFPLCSEMRSHY